MRKTPRTDCHIAWNPQWGGGVISADFARMLERENAELAEALRKTVDALDDARNHIYTNARDVSEKTKALLAKREKGAT